MPDHIVPNMEAAAEPLAAPVAVAEGEAAPPSLPAEEAKVLAGRSPIWTVFRHRNYRLYFTGQLVSLMGTWMQSIAQGWLVYDLTHSPFLLGVTTFAAQLPILVGSPFGGALADRWRKRDLILIAQCLSAVQAATLAVLTLTGLIEVWHVVMLALLLGCINAIDVPARQSFIIDMVGKADLRPAIALNSIMFNTARVVGPSIAGLLIALVGEGTCFAINAISYGSMIFALLSMRVPSHVGKKAGSPLKDVLEGFRYVMGHAPIKAALLLLAAANMFGGSYTTLMPAIARDVLHTDAQGFGIMMASAGIGAIFGAYTMTQIPERYIPLAPVISAAAFGAGLIFFSQSTLFWLSVAFLVGAQFGLMVQSSSSNTFIQTHCDEAMRGRVMAFFAMAIMGTVPIGSLILGAIAGRFGSPAAVALGGTLCVAAAIAAYWKGHLRPEKI